MRHIAIVVASLFAIIVAVVIGTRTFMQSTPQPVGGGNVPSVVTSHDNLIRVTSPAANATVKSPLTISGTARGTWYFEASFPIRIYDANGKLLGTTIGQAQSDWMTEEFVPFTATLTFSKSATAMGTIVFQKDNPSGLPEHDDQLVVPVKFDMSASLERAVLLYAYDASKDKDTNGNIMCSKNGLVAISRTMPVTQTPIQDAVKLLLKSGGLTASEKQQGLTTEYPLAGVELTGASVNSGVLTLALNDPQAKTDGGSCRVGILWAQIEATAKQFDGITSVKFTPAELFQP